MEGGSRGYGLGVHRRWPRRRVRREKARESLGSVAHAMCIFRVWGLSLLLLEQHRTNRRYIEIGGWRGRDCEAKGELKAGKEESERAVTWRLRTRTNPAWFYHPCSLGSIQLSSWGGEKATLRKTYMYVHTHTSLRPTRIPLFASVAVVVVSRWPTIL